MSLKTKLRTLTAFAALIGLGTTSLSAAEGGCGSGQQLFEGTFTIKERIQFLAAPQGLCAAIGTINGEGATAFGPTAVDTVDCITPLVGTPTNIFSSTDVTFTFGRETLRAAYVGQATATMSPSSPVPAALDVIGSLTFTGGTGRFATARGAAVVRGREEFESANPATGVAVYVGRIAVSGCLGAVR